MSTLSLPLALLLTLCAASAAEPLLNASKGLGLHGFDPVSYSQTGGPREGRDDLTATSGGATYRFATAENRTAFSADPQRYLPLYGGWCAYAMADSDFVDVDPKTYKIVDGKTLLFYNGWLGNTLKSWNKTEATLRPKADANWTRIVSERGGK